ncbi:MAG: hypothetical protein [Olavius algarvensis Delta 4 endosymbiont]|nr:MAG: hypothetical protein [Olavius algarvensis Delta 4 endosymbiont]
MPIETSTSENGLGSIIDCSDVVVGDELIDALSQNFNRQAEFRRHRYLILDFSAVTRMNLKEETTDTIVNLCAAAVRTNPDLLVAVVAYFSMAVSIDVINRMKGLYELFQHRSDWESLVFRTRPEAVRWIRKRSAEKFS